jgi:hypothetical protein
MILRNSIRVWNQRKRRDGYTLTGENIAVDEL